jgi:hypothetical protein
VLDVKESQLGGGMNGQRDEAIGVRKVGFDDVGSGFEVAKCSVSEVRHNLVLFPLFANAL